LAGKVVTAGATVAINAILARALSRAEYGGYCLAFSLVAFGATVALLGLDHAVVRSVASEHGRGRPDRAVQILRITTKLVLCGAVGVAVVFWLTGGYVAQSVFQSGALGSVIGLCALWMALATLRTYLSQAFRGFHDIARATLFGGLFSGVVFLGALVVLWTTGKSNLSRVLWLMVGALTLSICLAALLLRRRLTSANKATPSSSAEGPPPPTPSSLLRASLPMLLNNLLTVCLMQGAMWVLAIVRGEDEVAVYGAAARLVAMVGMPLVVANAVTPPFIAELYAQGRRKHLEHVLRATASIASVPAVIGLVAFVAFAGPILRFVYSGEYHQGADVLALLCLGQLAHVCAGSSGLLLLMTRHQVAGVVILLISTAVTLAGAFVFARWWGMTGAALGAAVGLIVQSILAAGFGRIVIGVRPYVDVLWLLGARPGDASRTR
jgi:O-antigen/teichoic acid export membrane protein